MLVKVKKDFIDKHTKVLHEKGSTFSCDEGRFVEIMNSGNYVEIIPQTEEKAEIKEEQKSEAVEEQAETPSKPAEVAETKKKTTERKTKNGSKRK